MTAGVLRGGAALLAAGLLAMTAAACGGEEETSPRMRLSETVPDRSARVAADDRAVADGTPVVTVYKSPTCGCCADWVEHLRSAGFEVETVDDEERLYEAKRRHGVGPHLSSCHTAEVGGYFVEGHVPADDLERLLAEAPADVLGLAVPGMPMGSPGMEGPRKDDYDVLAVKPDGRTEVYARH